MPLSLKMRAVLLMARLTDGKPLNELPVPEARQAVGLHPKTLRNYVSNIFSKLHLTDRSQAYRTCPQHGVELIFAEQRL